MELTRGGASSDLIQDLAKDHGLQSRLIRLDLDQFSAIEGPCMAYVRGDIADTKHLVVIFKVDGDKILIGDPAKGKYKTTLAAFSEDYLGNLIVFRPNEQLEPGIHSQSYARRFLKFVAGYRSLIARSLLLGTVVSATGFGLIYLSKLFVDDVLPSDSTSMVWAFALIYFMARLLNVAMNSWNSLFTVYLKNRIQGTLSQDFFNRTLGLEKKHIDSRDAGDFMMLFSQIGNLTQGLATYYSQFILVVFGMLVKSVLLIYFYDPLLASIILCIVALNSTAGFIFARKTSEHTNRQGFLFSQINTAILNTLSDIRVVRVFKAENWVHDIFKNLLKEGLEMVEKVTRLNVWGRFTAESLNIISEAAIFLICGYRILSGSYSIGDFLLFMTFAQSLAAESLQFPGLILNFHAQLRAHARIQAVFELSQETGGHTALPPHAPEIVFENVNFAYPGGGLVLENVSFCIRGDETTAFVGESGSGKTTIMNLIMGFYRPQSGRILINGIDLTQLDLAQWRDLVSAVFQDTPIFNRSIMANVAFDNPDIPRERVIEIAQRLGISDFIDRLPEGYDHLTYQGGLSGGQTQRLGILRALVKPFRLLLLDEATSSLDSLTEERIVHGIKAMSGK